jgi:hypothetical protein
MIYAIVNEASGAVVNRCDVDSHDELFIPEGCVAVEETGTALFIGGTYIDGVYTPPTSGPLPKPRASTEVLYDHENRLRVFEGLPPMSMQDFITKNGLD